MPAAESDIPPARLVPRAEPWWTNSFMVTFAFHCNIACTFCMVEDVLNVLPGTSLDSFRRFIDRQRGAKDDPFQGVCRIIFSGGEVTLSKELLEYVALARQIPGVEHVRLQTNATRLADRDYLRALVDAGVDEYFVSVHAPDQPLYRAIAQRKTAFEQIVAGLGAIADSGATLITNTAIVASNYRRLPEIVERVLPFRPRSMEFWNYWPRADEDHGLEHVAPVAEVRPPLIEALTACVAAGVPPVVKWFPRCLLGPFAVYQDDGQPPALIEDGYWDRRPEYACLHEGVCEQAPDCSGLSFVYIRRFGWEQDVLQPRRKPAPFATAYEKAMVASLVGENGPPARDRAGDAAAVESWLRRFDLALGAQVGPGRLVATMLARDGGAVGLAFAVGDRTIEVRLLPTDANRKCFARTRSFDFMFARFQGDPSPAAALVVALLSRIRPHDRGDLALPRPPSE